MSKKCDVCGLKLGLINNFKIKDGNICSSCIHLSSSYATESITDMKKYFNINKDRLSLFCETQILKNFSSTIVHIDDNHHLFYCGNPNDAIVYSFDEIIDCGYDITESETTSKKGGVTRAIVGAAVAGSVGAIIGASTAKEKTSTNTKETFYFNVKTYSGIKKVTILFPPKGFKEFIEKCISEYSNQNNISINELSISDKIKSILDLKEQGILNEEEYENKKKELLSKL